MSKKTNALKKQTKVKRNKRKNTGMQRYGPNVPFMPIFSDPFNTGFGLLGMMLGIGIPRVSINAWVCDPCGVQVDLIRPVGVPEPNFCPRCRGPLRRLGEPPQHPQHSATTDGAIETTCEDVTYPRLPAPKEPK